MEWYVWSTWRIISCIKYSRLFWIYLKKRHREKAHILSIRVYVNKIEHGITFKIKTKSYLEILTPKQQRNYLKAPKKG